MATPEDIENRLTAVERNVAELQQRSELATTDASAARTLAAGADHDVSEVRAELRAHTSALSALRQTQVEFQHALVDMSRRIDGLERTTHEGFAMLGGGMAQIVGLLEDKDR